MKVERGQSFLDIVLQGTGSIENALEMAIANGVSPTDDIVINQEIKATAVTKRSIQSIWGEKNKPASALTEHQETIIPARGGIGYMKIGETFKVS